MIKCCIFDLDGTILNTITTITHFVNNTLQKFGYPNITEDQCKHFVGNGARLLITRALAHFGVTDEKTVDTVLDAYDRDYKADPYYLTAKYDGIDALLSGLHRAGIRLAVVSNKQDRIAKDAVAHFFPDTFDLVVGGKDGVPLKPAPDAPVSVLTTLGFTPDECAFIGDTAVDVQTGKNMNAAMAIGVSWGFREREELSDADCIADDPAQILRALTEQNF